MRTPCWKTRTARCTGERRAARTWSGSTRPGRRLTMRRDILVYPDPFLARKAAPVTAVDDRVRALIRDMFETMYGAEGVGLAAPQVGVGKRVIVVDVSPVDNTIPPVAVVNPEIVERTGSVVAVGGGLGGPGIQGEVRRAETVVVRGRDEQGKAVRVRAGGSLSRARQHEIDHLDGILFIDRIPSAEAASAKSPFRLPGPAPPPCAPRP